MEEVGAEATMVIKGGWQEIATSSHNDDAIGCRRNASRETTIDNHDGDDELALDTTKFEAIKQEQEALDVALEER